MVLIPDTIIIINSSNRSSNVVTTAFFPKDTINWEVLVPDDEYVKYKPHVQEGHLTALPKDVPKCLSDQRQWAIEHYTALGYKFVWFMDDDLKYLRRVDDTTKLRSCTTEDVYNMFYYMRNMATEIPYVGVSARFGNNNIVDYLENCRVSWSYIIDLEVFKKVGAVFNPIPMMLGQDTHMSLCFLNAGYRTRVIGKFALTEKSGASGGCAVYRDGALQKRCVMWMVENHPEVKLKTKITKSDFGLESMKDGRKFRVDYTVQWKKAYKPKIARTGQGGMLHNILKGFK